MPTLKNLLAKQAPRNLSTPPHLVVIARAGTGKTTTLVEGLKYVRGGTSTLTPSPQQQVIWDSMALSHDAQSVCFCAFNRAIASELKARVPEGCEAMTLHSLGLRAITNQYGRLGVSQWRTQNLVAGLCGYDTKTMNKTAAGRALLYGTNDLIGLVKMNLSHLYEDKATGEVESLDVESEPHKWYEVLSELVEYYEIDIPRGSGEAIFKLVPRVIDLCRQPDRDNQIDFDDMVWLPVYNNLLVSRYDLLCVDEAQDLNRCQQQLALKSGHRLVLCGDPKQAIYGFAGADAESMPRMTTILEDSDRGCETLYLTVTRRCGKAIVREAQRYVPEFEAHESNPPGCITSDDMKTYAKGVQDGAMILCRCNAPLVSECFRFLADGRKATIRGRDIGVGLITTIKKLRKKANLNPYTCANLTSDLEKWLAQEYAKEQTKKNPNEQRLIGLEDRVDCLNCFIANAETVDEVIEKIEAVFSDESGDGIQLSSVHRAKGLESSTVYLLQPSGAQMPHPMAKTPWQREQEQNLLYVAVTRAINNLVHVGGKVISRKESAD